MQEAQVKKEVIRSEDIESNESNHVGLLSKTVQDLFLTAIVILLSSILVVNIVKLVKTGPNKDGSGDIKNKKPAAKTEKKSEFLLDELAPTTTTTTTITAAK